MDALNAQNLSTDATSVDKSAKSIKINDGAKNNQNKNQLQNFSNKISGINNNKIKIFSNIIFDDSSNEYIDGCVNEDVFLKNGKLNIMIDAQQGFNFWNLKITYSDNSTTEFNNITKNNIIIDFELDDITIDVTVYLNDIITYGKIFRSYKNCINLKTSKSNTPNTPNFFNYFYKNKIYYLMNDLIKYNFKKYNRLIIKFNDEYIGTNYTKYLNNPNLTEEDKLNIEYNNTKIIDNKEPLKSLYFWRYEDCVLLNVDLPVNYFSFEEFDRPRIIRDKTGKLTEDIVKTQVQDIITTYTFNSDFFMAYSDYSGDDNDFKLYLCDLMHYRFFDNILNYIKIFKEKYSFDPSTTDNKIKFLINNPLTNFDDVIIEII